MFVLLIVLQICWHSSMALVELKSKTQVSSFTLDQTTLKPCSSQVDHKKVTKKCMMSHRVLGQKKNIVTSAPILYI